jgi:hypothetical protein
VAALDSHVTMMRSLRAALLLLGTFIAAPSSAQMSGCVRDATGALQCTLQRSPGGTGPAASTRAIQRPDLGADAVRRSNAMIEARRQAIEQQRTEREEAADRQRRECRDRAAGDAGKLAGCGL